MYLSLRRQQREEGNLGPHEVWAISPTSRTLAGTRYQESQIKIYKLITQIIKLMKSLNFKAQN